MDRYHVMVALIAAGWLAIAWKLMHALAVCSP